MNSVKITIESTDRWREKNGLGFLALYKRASGIKKKRYNSSTHDSIQVQYESCIVTKTPETFLCASEWSSFHVPMVSLWQTTCHLRVPHNKDLLLDTHNKELHLTSFNNHNFEAPSSDHTKGV